MAQPSGRERLIVALDVPSSPEAIAVVRRLGDAVDFYKIGWQLFITGELRGLLEALGDKRVFIDLKVPGDIGNTLKGVVEFCVASGVRFLTLSDFVPPAAIAAAIAARGSREYPKLLGVPFLSSLDAGDLERMHGTRDLGAYLLARAKAALDAGVDGLIASGAEIARIRNEHPSHDVLIVSPGIRPAGADRDDHKRSTSPAQAIEMGADYLVVGRPILRAPDPPAAAHRIIEEIDRALEAAGRRGSGSASDGLPRSSPARPVE